VGILRSPTWVTAAVTALLCACGGLDNAPLEHGDLVGRVLRAQKDAGRVVLMSSQPIGATFDDAGNFHFSSVPAGRYEMLVVASDTEALRLPVTVSGAETTELGDLDPLPAAFIRINLSTQGEVMECWVTVHRTDLNRVHSPPGSYQFTAGPLGAGCYDTSMGYLQRAFWSRSNICLEPGEQRSFDVEW